MTQAHLVGRMAAGDDDRVEALYPGRVGREVRGDGGLPALALVLGASRGTDKCDRCASHA